MTSNPRQPHTTVTAEFSSPDLVPTAWETGRSLMANARIYWIATMHRSGQPHIAPVYGIWLDGTDTDTGTWYFCTGAHEQKAVNLRSNPHCTVLTGTNAEAGIDVVLQGRAVQVTDHALLQRIADAYRSKHGWEFPIQDGVFLGGDTGDRPAPVFAVAPVKGHAFSRDEPGGQTRWVF